jgi:hypothetical protein
MKRVLIGLWAFCLLALVSPALSVQAQIAATTAPHAGPFHYDSSQETTINGKVSSVVTKPTQGMLMGSHLLVETSSGTVDASLGSLALRGKDAPTFAAGQQVTLTGIMKTLKDKEVFLARTVKIGEQVYTFRNEHGFPVREAAGSHETVQPAEKGVQP